MKSFVKILFLLHESLLLPLFPCFFFMCHLRLRIFLRLLFVRVQRSGLRELTVDKDKETF